MSSFLGPIHFWLYDKIKMQEELTAYLYDFSKKEGWLESGSDADRAAAALVKTDLKPLDQLIDTMNIHGWLQECIHDAEGRNAKLVFMLIYIEETENSQRISGLEKAAFEFGKLHGVGQVPVRDAYKYFEDSFLNGMPCDRVNVITDQDDFRVGWEQTTDIHGEYWHEAGACPEVYYKLRKQVMLGMLEGSGMELENPDYLHYAIKAA